MISKKQYLQSLRWLEANKGLINKHQDIVDNYQSHREPYKDVKPWTKIQDIPEFNRFNLGAIRMACTQLGLGFSHESLSVSNLTKRSLKEWSECYGIGSGTISKIKAATLAAGLKMKVK